MFPSTTSSYRVIYISIAGSHLSKRDDKFGVKTSNEATCSSPSKSYLAGAHRRKYQGGSHRLGGDDFPGARVSTSRCWQVWPSRGI